MTDKTSNEQKLWNSFIQGNLAAFEGIYKQYYPLLCAYGIRLAGDKELVTDTIQDLFVKLILNCKKLGTTDNVKAYLFCAFRNKLLDALHALRPMEEIGSCHDFFPAEEDSISILRGKDDQEVANERKLRKAVSRLSGRQREILYLYYVKGLSHQEISEILGINPQSSKNLLARTLTRLRELFFSSSFAWLSWLLLVGWLARFRGM